MENKKVCGRKQLINQNQNRLLFANNYSDRQYLQSKVGIGAEREHSAHLITAPH